MKDDKRHNLTKLVLIPIIIIGIVLAGVWIFSPDSDPQDKERFDQEWSYPVFIKLMEKNQIKQVTLDRDVIKGYTYDKIKFRVINPGDPKLIDDLLYFNVPFKAIAYVPETRSMWTTILFSFGPILLLIAAFIFIARKQMGGGMGSMGKSKAKMVAENNLKTRFKDVAGCDEAREEISDIEEFLKDPKKFQRLGGKIPRGALMVGPPGCGKTLLARAIAGESKVPFFTISGSDFVEMFVGVGASRVRDMFEQARKVGRCIIFIDEIDAVGGKRGTGIKHDEREQTLNQLLVEMDGFDEDSEIIVIAATNRADTLDEALLRPGRFDRKVYFNLPDIKGREQILKVHLKNVQTDNTINPKDLARGTPGFSGAELANVINEAALFAAKLGKELIGMPEMERAKDKMLMGYEKKTMFMDDTERMKTALHEAGHCLVGELVPEHDPTYKVSIMPRGQALGVTMFLPEEDQYSLSKRKVESQLSALYAGRIAECEFYDNDSITTGASNDIERATELASNAIRKWGFGEKSGPINYSAAGSDPFGHGSAQPGQESHLLNDAEKLVINSEIRQLIDKNYKRAEDIIRDNMDIMQAMADALMKFETIDRPQIDRLLARELAGNPLGWEDSESDNEETKEEIEIGNDISEDATIILTDEKLQD